MIPKSVDDASVEVLDDNVFNVTFTNRGKFVTAMVMTMEQIEELQLAMVDAVVRKREEVHNKPITIKK